MQGLNNVMEQLFNSAQQSTYTILGNTPIRYLIALGILLISFVVFKIVCSAIIKQLKVLTAKTKAHWDDLFTQLIARNTPLFVWTASFYISIQFLYVNATLDKVINAVFAITLAIISIRIVQGMLTFWFNKKYFEAKHVDVGKKSVMKNMLLFLKVILWFIVCLFVLDNLGFDITTMVAGLGIGGMAIALASQNILSDIFSYFTIFFDKPFEAGDFIVVGDLLGVVEHIGIKTTRVKSLQGEQLVFGNADLMGSRIKNFKKMEQRRIATTIGVIYETPEDKLKTIPKIIEDIITKQDSITFDRAHFKSFGDFSLDFEFVYYVHSGDYAAYMDVQQAINLGLFSQFAKEGIEFAYPTQVVHVHK
jgi:small-conductance mechanosensitive channel